MGEARVGEDLAGLPTERRNARSERMDELPTLGLLEAINDEDATIAAAVRAALPAVARAVDAIAERFAAGGRLYYLGAGTSGRLGVLDASECPPTFSVEPGLFVGLIAGGDGALRRSSEGAEDSREQGAADVLAGGGLAAGVTGRDAVVGIAASGRTPWVLGALGAARGVGALTVGLTCAGGAAEASPVAQASEIAIELATGAEMLTGSTRMKAGTATKMVLNMISTGVMVRRGAVLGNLMVNVQPTNAKLVDRAERIIAAAAGVGPVEAAQALREAGEVKIAILMLKRRMPYGAARARLKRLQGNLRQALDETT